VAVDGLLCEGQNCVHAGGFGVGKTMWWLQASLCIASGHDVAGRKVQRPFRVAFIDFENDIGEIKGRIRCQIDALRLNAAERRLVDENFIYYNATDPDDPLYGIALDNRAPEDKLHKSIHPLSEFISKSKPEFLILDNGGLVCPSELKEPDDVRKLRKNLKELRAKHTSLQDGAINMLHHLTKPGQKLPSGDRNTLLYSPREWLAQVRGSGRLMDYVEARLGITEEEVKGKRLYVVNGINRSLAVIPLVMEFDTESLLFNPVADEKVRLACLFVNAEKKQVIAEALRQLPNEFSFTQAEQLKDHETGCQFNNKTLSGTLKVLVAHNFLRKTPAGLYVKDRPELFA
jgi:hypothetical protein